MKFPLIRYEGVEKVRKKKEASLPVINEYKEFKTFGNKLIKLPQKKAEAFILIQNIIDIRDEIESKK